MEGLMPFGMVHVGVRDFSHNNQGGIAKGSIRFDNLHKIGYADAEHDAPGLGDNEGGIVINIIQIFYKP